MWALDGPEIEDDILDVLLSYLIALMKKYATESCIVKDKTKKMRAEKCVNYS